MRKPVKTADQHDLVCRWYRRTQMRGRADTATIKRRLRRWYRRTGKDNLRKGIE